MSTKGPPVLITTANRGVFFGYITRRSGSNVCLKNARNCIYWRELRGFLDLANNGPNAQCRIGACGDIELFNVTSISQVTAKAVTAWECAPW